ncbi:MAG TPA: hypothetical protein VFV71_01550 [Burkholderiales bacterium]|nr:hypothetical protein [Burkholderiales bacterium]
MAKPNYAFAKRQKEMAKKQKREEKRLKKAEAAEGRPQEAAAPLPSEDKPAAG